VTLEFPKSRGVRDSHKPIKPYFLTEFLKLIWHAASQKVECSFPDEVIDRPVNFVSSEPLTEMITNNTAESKGRSARKVYNLSIIC
jgi:hypothetical protein